MQLNAQERTVEGIVFDAGTKYRITRVYIYNTRSHKGQYNNSRGEFSTQVRKGDVLIAATQGYLADTLTYTDQQALIFYLRRTSILLREVTITDTVGSPEKRYKKLQEEYKASSRVARPQDLVQFGGGNRTGGTGLGIDALYSLLSREGRNARHLQEILERDYHQMIVDYKYTPSLVSGITGLKGDELRDFMEQYRPSYYFVLNSNDYNLIAYIRESYKRYQKNPALNRLPPLKP